MKLSDATQKAIDALNNKQAGEEPEPTISGIFSYEDKIEKEEKEYPGKYIQDEDGQIWELIPDSDTTMSNGGILEGNIKLVGEPKIDEPTLLKNVQSEGKVNRKYWKWAYNNDVTRPLEATFSCWYRPEGVAGPVADMLVMINYKLYVVSLWFDKFTDEAKEKPSFRLSGNTEEMALHLIAEAKKKKQEAEMEILQASIKR